MASQKELLALIATLNDRLSKLERGGRAEGSSPPSTILTAPLLPPDCKLGFGDNTVYDARNIRIGTVVDGQYVPDPEPSIPTPAERQEEALRVQKALEAKYSGNEPWQDPCGVWRQGKEGQRVSIIEDEKQIRKQVEAEMAVEHRAFLGRDAS